MTETNEAAAAEKKKEPKPGRDLDARIALRLGLNPVWHYPENWPHCDCKNLMFPTSLYPSGWDEVPYYSTDIAAAFELADAVSDKLNLVFELIRYTGENEYKWGAEFVGYKTFAAPTAPHAVCLAFLTIEDKEKE